MISKEKLVDITDYLITHVFRNENIMLCEDNFANDDNQTSLADIIASLHNLLYEAVTGERYNYMFHWANKVGGDCLDNIFDDEISEGTRKENHISKEEYFASCHDALESVQSVLKNPILKKSASDMLKAIEVTHMITKAFYEATNEKGENDDD